MLRALTLLFLCQLAGETVVRVIGLTFPGPVLGMGLLLAILLIRGKSWPDLDGVADTILRNLVDNALKACIAGDGLSRPPLSTLADPIRSGRRIDFRNEFNRLAPAIVG